MLTTHLAVLSFLNGASTYVVPNPGNFAGFHTLGPYAHLTGFSPVDAPVSEERNRGGWIDPAVLRKLRKQAQEDRRRPYDAKKRKERERVAELSALYDSITGTEIAGKVADIIRPVAKTEALIPQAAQIDMNALARNADMLRQLERIVTEYAEQQEDEELLLLALIH